MTGCTAEMAMAGSKIAHILFEERADRLRGRLHRVGAGVSGQRYKMASRRSAVLRCKQSARMTDEVGPIPAAKNSSALASRMEQQAAHIQHSGQVGRKVASCW